MESTEELRYYAQLFADRIVIAIVGICEDSDSKEAFQESINKISFSLGSGNAVTSSDGQLILSASVEKGMISTWTEKRLQEEIEHFL